MSNIVWFVGYMVLYFFFGLWFFCGNEFFDYGNYFFNLILFIFFKI